MKRILIIVCMLPLFTFAENGKCEGEFKSNEAKTPSKAVEKHTKPTKTAEQKKKEEAAKAAEQKKKEEESQARAEKEVATVKDKVLYMLEKTLITPRAIDVARYLEEIPKKRIEEIMEAEITVEFWKNLEQENPDYIKRLKNLVARAFIASIRDNNVRWKNKTPNVERLFKIYSRTHENKHDLTYPKNALTEHYLALMLGAGKASNKKATSSVPVLFPEGMEEVEFEAKKITPSAFQNYINTSRFSYAADQETARLIIQSKGAIVTTVTAGIPVNKDMFENMLVLAKERGFPIVIIPVNQQTEGIDPYLLTIPNVHIVTHSIVLSEYLKIWTLPVMPKNAGPFASLKNFAREIEGMVQIVASPQQLYQANATADNKHGTHALWSPGSISENLYPSKNPASQRVSELAKHRHAYGFLVLEMTNKDSGLSEKGVPGAFHIRPVKYLDQSKVKIPGFTDLGAFYSNKKKSKANVDTMVVGDIHDHHTNQTLLRIYENVIKEYDIKTLVLHDILDGNSHNHHESNQLNLQLNKYKKGELNIQREVEGVVQTLNGLLEKFPNLNIVINDSNHHYWLEHLLDYPKSLEDVPNTEFLTELLFARNNLGLNIYEYLFNSHRESFHNSLKPRYVRHEKLKQTIYISDSSRVKMLSLGESFIVGPDSNPVYLHFHGHKGANGARGGMVPHAQGSPQSVTGHSHQPAMLRNAINVGTSTPKEVDYSKGGYSSWQNAFALINSDAGAVQLVVYEPNTGLAWKQNPKGDFLPISSQPKPIVELTDNEKSPSGAEVIDQYNNFKNKLKK